MKNNKPKVILLVAGEGKRLRPYTLDRPKCMVEIEGVSLIDRQLAVLKAEGLADIVMIGGYKADMLKREGIKLKINPRYYETNMVWTLFSAEEELEGDVVVSYGDIVYSREILQALLKSKADIAVAVDKDWESYWRARNEDPLDDAETLKLRGNGTISEIGQKPKSIDEMKKIGRSINAPLVANMIEGGATPISSTKTLHKMGFQLILYPLSILYANTFATLKILKELKSKGTTTRLKNDLVNFDQFNDIVELSKFRKLEGKYSK